MIRDEAGIEFSAAKVRMFQNLLIVIGRGPDAMQAHVIDGALRTGEQASQSSAHTISFRHIES